MIFKINMYINIVWILAELWCYLNWRKLLETTAWESSWDERKKLERQERELLKTIQSCRWCFLVYFVYSLFPFFPLLLWENHPPPLLIKKFNQRLQSVYKSLLDLLSKIKDLVTQDVSNALNTSIDRVNYTNIFISEHFSTE